MLYLYYSKTGLSKQHFQQLVNGNVVETAFGFDKTEILPPKYLC